MEIRWEAEGARLTVGLSGRLDTMNALVLDDRFAGIPEEISSIVFDLDGLNYIASSGLRVLFWAHKYSHNKGGEMTVINVSPEVLETLEVTGFSELIQVEQPVNETAHGKEVQEI